MKKNLGREVRPGGKVPATVHGSVSRLGRKYAKSWKDYEDSGPQGFLGKADTRALCLNKRDSYWESGSGWCVFNLSAWFRGQVGRSWNSVYSDFRRAARNAPKTRRFIMLSMMNHIVDIKPDVRFPDRYGLYVDEECVLRFRPYIRFRSSQLPKKWNVTNRNFNPKLGRYEGYLWSGNPEDPVWQVKWISLKDSEVVNEFFSTFDLCLRYENRKVCWWDKDMRAGKLRYALSTVRKSLANNFGDHDWLPIRLKQVPHKMIA